VRRSSRLDGALTLSGLGRDGMARMRGCHPFVGRVTDPAQREDEEPSSANI